MLDWLRYFPIAFRDPAKGYITPKGPYFSALRPQRWVVGDNQYTFKAPWTNGVWGTAWRSKANKSRSPGRFKVPRQAYTFKPAALKTLSSLLKAINSTSHDGEAGFEVLDSIEPMFRLDTQLL